ncbi:MAG: hypothetical protein K8T90_11325 [Planctomycetes bacterium]|nr:hypothetical protein [Planctomycetota bacterium]
MRTNDPRVRCLLLNGQEVLAPTAAAWREIVRVGNLDDTPISALDRVTRWLDEYSELEAASLGVVNRGQGSVEQ